MAFLGSIIKPLAYLSVPIFVIRQLSFSQSQTLRYYSRLGLYLGAMTAVAACGLLVAAGMALVGRRYDVNWVIARWFHATASRLIDIEIEVEGEEHLQTKPAVMLGNHQSIMDIFLLGRMFPQRAVMVAKKELRLTPLGPWMTMSGAVWLDRGNSARAVRSLEAAGAQMKRENLSLWIFPEGTRHLSEATDLLPFKKGGFHLAVQSGLPIIPVVFENYWRLYHKGVFEAGKLKIRILPPIPTTGLTTSEVNDLVLRVRDQMLASLREISVNAPAASGSGGTKEQLPSHPRSSGPTHDLPHEVKVPTVGAISDAKESTLGAIGDVPDVSTTSDAGESRGSGESLGSVSDASAASPTRRTYEPSENGTETEEDEGMVLVGRPL